MSISRFHGTSVEVVILLFSSSQLIYKYASSSLHINLLHRDRIPLKYKRKEKNKTKTNLEKRDIQLQREKTQHLENELSTNYTIIFNSWEIGFLIHLSLFIDSLCTMHRPQFYHTYPFHINLFICYIQT